VLALVLLPLIYNHFLKSVSILTQKSIRILTASVIFALSASLIYWTLDTLSADGLSHILNKHWFARANMLLGITLCAISQRSSARPWYIVTGLFILVITVQQPTGVWMMTLAFWQWLVTMQIANPDSPLAALATSFLAYAIFFATGHQVTFSSIQFQMGFIGLESFNYYISGALVAWNTIGPTLFFITVMCLFSSKQTVFTMMLHRTAVTCLSTVLAGYLRRHLMVWKIFAPRFMLAAIDLVLLDLVIIGVVVMPWFLHLITTNKKQKM
jgi:hypothetical protein